MPQAFYQSIPLELRRKEDYFFVIVAKIPSLFWEIYQILKIQNGRFNMADVFVKNVLNYLKIGMQEFSGTLITNLI